MNTIDPEQKEIIENLVEKAAVKIFLKEEGSVLATAQLIISNMLEINGFTIRESKFEGQDFWIQPPVHGKKYANSFFIKDKKIWGVVLEKVERAYKNKLDEEDVRESIEDIKF